MCTDADYVEPTQIGDIYSDGIADIELLGENVRLLLFTFEHGIRVVVAKIVLPKAAIKGNILELIAAKETASFVPRELAKVPKH